MRSLYAFAIPLATSLVVAVLLGIFTDAIRVDGPMSVLVMLVACAIAAAAVSMAMKGINGVVLGALGGASVVPIVLAIKLVRWPSAPVLGDGDVVVVLLVAYFVAAIIGAVAGRRLTAAWFARASRGS